MTAPIATYQFAKLGAHADILAGPPLDSERFTEVPEDVPLVKGENVQQGYIDWTIAKRWPLNDADNYKRYQLLPGDVVVAMDRPWVTAGLKWAYIKPNDPPALLVQRVARLRGKTTLDQGFLRCLISSLYFSNYIQPIVTGVNVPHISGKQIGDFKIPLPSLDIQKKIAALLTAYDDLLTNNQRRITLLERMAEEIYREWFVRLRFPGYEQGKFEKGVPSGWRLSPSSDAFEVLGGGTPNTDTPEYWNGDIPFFTPKDASANFYAMATEKSITEKGLLACSSQLFPKDIVFITARGTVGKLALASRPMAMNQSCYALKPKNANAAYFHYLAIRESITYLKGVAKSGVFDNIIMDTFKNVPIMIPPTALLEDFNQKAQPLFAQISTLLEHNQRLAEHRNALLPRLISGKLAVDKLDIHFPPQLTNA